MTDVVRFGEVNETTFDAPVKKFGSSYCVTISKVMSMMSLKEGDVVRVTLVKREEAEDDE